VAAVGEFVRSRCGLDVDPIGVEQRVDEDMRFVSIPRHR
jgi:hypothetical protein